MMLQPEPVCAHAVSVQPRAVAVLRASVVPPTDVTYGDEAGNCTAPESPALAVIAMPGWLNAACAAASMLAALPPPSTTPQLLLIDAGWYVAAVFTAAARLSRS